MRKSPRKNVTKKSTASTKKAVTKKVAAKKSAKRPAKGVVERLRAETRQLRKDFNSKLTQLDAANERAFDLEAELTNTRNALANVGNVALDYIKVARDANEYDAEELDGIRDSVIQQRELSGISLPAHLIPTPVETASTETIVTSDSTETIITPETCADDVCKVDTSARDERLRDAAQDAAESAQQNLADLVIAIVDPSAQHVLDGSNPVNEP